MRYQKPVHSETTQILDDLRRLLQTLRVGARVAESRLKISGAQLFVLQAVAQSPALSLNEVAERTRTHQSSVSVVVGRLVRAGYLSRARASDDGRRMELTVTARGAALLSRAPEAPQQKLIAVVEALPAPVRQTLMVSLDALVSEMHLQDEVPHMFFENKR